MTVDFPSVESGITIVFAVAIVPIFKTSVFYCRKESLAAQLFIFDALNFNYSFAMLDVQYVYQPVVFRILKRVAGVIVGKKSTN